MIIKSVNLETVAGITSRLPKNDKPEYAFAGKSNVGKSSLINAIMNRKNYARTSATPGKTQTINYYNINDELYLVDLPGYGYAKTSKESKEGWSALIDKYLEVSDMLKKVFLLVDIRHAPGANDIAMYKWMISRGFEPIIIATKLDKINRSQKDKQLKLIRETLQLSENICIIPFSSETKAGLEEIYTLFEE